MTDERDSISTNLRVLPTKNGEPDEKIVSEIEELLTYAKSGVIASVVLVYEFRKGDVRQFWFHGQDSYPSKLIGSVAQLQWSMIKRRDETKEILP